MMAAHEPIAAKMTGSDGTGTRARGPIIEEICGRLAAGESVNDVFRTPADDYPSERTFWRWVANDKEVCEAYERATEKRGEKFAEEIVSIADGVKGEPLLSDEGVPIMGRDGFPVMVLSKVAIEHARLRIDARKWVSARMLPGRYGDRTILAGDADNPIAVDDPKAIIARRLLAAATPVGNSEND